MDCSVCQHPGKPEIERLLASGAPTLRKVGEQFGICYASLYRHKKNHMTCYGGSVTNHRNKDGTVTSVTTERNKLQEPTVTSKRNKEECTVTNDRDKNGNRDNVDLYRYAKSRGLPEWDCYALWFWGNVYRDNPESEQGRFAREKILVPLLKKHPFLEEVITLEG